MSSPQPSDAPGASASKGPYAVKLAVFEGPLDLLLHLIRLNEVEITDIPIARVGEQYLEYLGLMRELDLDVAGDYLVMAATLAWIKSRMLLPPEGTDEDGEPIDPRAELVARLMEYQRYKEVAGELGERRLLGRDVFGAVGPGPDRPSEEDREIEVGLFELLNAFRNALRAEGPSGAAHEVLAEPITVRDRMIAVMGFFRERDSMEFEEVLFDEEGRAGGRPLIIASFLAVLELTRLAALRLYQSVDEACVPQGPIHLRRVDEPEGRDWTTRIAEVM